MSEVRGIAKGVLTQTLGPWKRPVAYLSKRLDPVAAGWPVCLWAVAATALLVKEADKLTLGQELALTIPHERWMSNTRITQCQAHLLDQPCVQFHKTLAINHASLLPDDDPEEPIQDCTEVTDAVQMAHPDLTDVPLSSPDKVLSRVAVVALDRTIWAQSLNRGTTAQKVKLLALIQALRWGHSAIHRERGLPTTAGKDIKNKEEFLDLLECTAKDIRKERQLKPEKIEPQTKLPRKPPKNHNPAVPGPTQAPSYTKQEEELAEQKQAIKGPDGWWTLPDDRLLVPEALGRTLVAQLHQATHLASPRLLNFCEAGTTKLRYGEHWEVDFTEIKPPASGYKYLLALIDTFSGWVEAYPTRTETASIVVKRLLQEIIPRFGLPVVIGSDNSPTFVAKKPVKTGPTSCPSPSYGPCVPSTGKSSSLLFEIMYSRPPPILPRVREKLKAGIHNHSLAQALHYTQRATHKLVRDALPVPTADLVHPFQPRDSVWGHYTVILSTPTAVEVDGTQTWLHHSQLLHQETAWILATSGLNREIPSLGSTQARRRLDTCRRGTGLHTEIKRAQADKPDPARHYDAGLRFQTRSLTSSQTSEPGTPPPQPVL
ncbi:hypothetical protein QTO34_007755 [Cnephaeus nilssonii]|uniref:Integrase catalytic domain-containing protein n=1 Tax=Cnephaeus nilssonii TaxID=3371016 RepID=A0AA40LGR6_CNENI|nr:hypothetical protein QTO34_007755 [Eptesicus nilssonii]